jgi:anaerobic ribonucleoside-triphosphate reductase activating protein
MLLHLLHFPVYSLGPGIRAGLWFQGCTLRCKGCLTPESWSFEPERAAPLGEVIRALRSFFGGTPRPDGLTISGGEPFDQPDALMEILRGVKAFGVEDVLIFSGYRADALTGRHPELPELAAAVVDGPFESGNPSGSVWKGSDNQSLTLWKNEFALRYERWASEKTRRLQRVRSENRELLIGIPRQEDAESLRNLGEL